MVLLKKLKKENKMKEFETIILSDIENGFSGAVLGIIKNDRLLYLNAFGYKKRYLSDFSELSINQRELMDVQTLFDIASNTKIYATTLSLMKLYFEKKYDLNNPISAYIRGFKINGNIPTISHLLNHSSGLAPEVHFYDEAIGTLFSQERKKTHELLRTGLSSTYVFGTQNIYSDTNFMLLGLMIEEITGMSLEAYVNKNFFEPLKLKNTCFTPLKYGFSPTDIAESQVDGNACNKTRSFHSMREYGLRGEVHDEKAFYSMEGVAGHAGLFSTVLDLVELTSIFYHQGVYKNFRFFDKETLEKFSQYSDSVDPSFGLGFRRAEGDGMKRFFGKKPSNTSYGHTGFTGTLTLIDPENNLRIIYLSNRIHGPLSGRLEFKGRNMKSGSYGEIVDAIYNEYIK